MKKTLSLLLILILACLPLLSLAEADTTDYLYTFIPGNVLQGEGTQLIHDVMDAIAIQFTRQREDGGTIVRLRLISEGNEAFTLTAEESASGDFGLMCSLLGSNLLVCRRDQTESFLLTIVEMLADLNILKGDSLEKVEGLAKRAAAMLENYLSADNAEPESGINLKPYLKVLEDGASESEVREIPPEERDSLGAVQVATYKLNEQERRELVDVALEKLNTFPVIGDELKSGNLRIGEQQITNEFIRKILSETPGEMKMEVYTDAEEKLVRLKLIIPDLTDLVTDPTFAKVQGVEMTIRREYGAGKQMSSVTTVSLPGLEGDLMTVKLNRSEGERIPELKAKKVREVGELNSRELWDLVMEMKWTIAGNAANFFLSLPKVIFDLVVDKIF